MKRAGWLSILVATGLLTVAVIAHAQQPKKVSRIGYLSSVDPALESTHSEGIRLALRERGYIEGQNIATESRYAERKQDWFLELAAELVRLKVDIIVAAGGSRMVRAAKNATKTIPIVMARGGSDPVAAGLIESLAPPGGNGNRVFNAKSAILFPLAYISGPPAPARMPSDSLNIRIDLVALQANFC